MKKHLPSLIVALLYCLFIYVFYRTDKTLINQFIIALFSEENYISVKESVTSFLPLRDFAIYSLPEGLWVFCITLTSSFFYLEVQNRRWYLEILPLLLAVILELFQWLHFTNGRFDIIDIAFAAGFWLLALLCTWKNPSKEPLFQSLNSKTVWCVLSYSIVYLAHVTY